MALNELPGRGGVRIGGVPAATPTQQDALGQSGQGWALATSDTAWAPGSGAVGPGARWASLGSVTRQAKQCYHFLSPKLDTGRGHGWRNLPVYFKKAWGCFPSLPLAL